MIESQVVKEWEARGEVRGRVAAVVHVAELRFGALPPEVAVRVQAVADLARLDQLLTAAMRCPTLEEFLRELPA